MHFIFSVWLPIRPDFQRALTVQTEPALIRNARLLTFYGIVVRGKDPFIVVIFNTEGLRVSIDFRRRLCQTLKPTTAAPLYRRFRYFFQFRLCRTRAIFDYRRRYTNTGDTIHNNSNISYHIIWPRIKWRVFSRPGCSWRVLSRPLVMLGGGEFSEHNYFDRRTFARFMVTNSMAAKRNRKSHSDVHGNNNNNTHYITMDIAIWRWCLQNGFCAGPYWHGVGAENPEKRFGINEILVNTMPKPFLLTANSWLR